ncbi:hypothetical protein BGX26_002438 [Mortierella sp. AD094]|nr:hypothetical protein BGX26_002438 [Mortierella sp. AD094]
MSSTDGSKEEQDTIDSNLLRQQAALVDEKSRLCRPLSKVFRGAKGCRSLLDHQVKLREFEVFEESIKCLVEKTDVLVLADTIFCKDDEHRRKEDGIFLCMQGNANIDYRWIMQSGQEGKPLAIFLQAKHSELTTKGDTFNHDDLQKWYNLILNSTRSYNKDYEVVIVVITNKRYTAQDPEKRNLDVVIQGMPQLLLVEQSCIAQYLSPTFAYRGILAQPDDYKTEQIQPIPLE